MSWLGCSVAIATFLNQFWMVKSDGNSVRAFAVKPAPMGWCPRLKFSHYLIIANMMMIIAVNSSTSDAGKAG